MTLILLQADVYGNSRSAREVKPHSIYRDILFLANELRARLGQDAEFQPIEALEKQIDSCKNGIRVSTDDMPPSRLSASQAGRSNPRAWATRQWAESVIAEYQLRDSGGWPKSSKGPARNSKWATSEHSLRELLRPSKRNSDDTGATRHAVSDSGEQTLMERPTSRQDGATTHDVEIDTTSFPQRSQNSGGRPTHLLPPNAT